MVLDPSGYKDVTQDPEVMVRPPWLGPACAPGAVWGPLAADGLSRVQASRSSGTLNRGSMNSSEPLAQGQGSISWGRLTGPPPSPRSPPAAPSCSSSLSIHAPPFLSLLSSLFPNLVFEFHSLQGFFDVIDKRRCGEIALWLSVNSLFMHLEAKGVLSDSLWSSWSGCCPRAWGGDECWAGPLCYLGMAMGGQGQSWPTLSLSGCLGQWCADLPVLLPDPLCPPLGDHHCPLELPCPHSTNQALPSELPSSIRWDRSVPGIRCVHITELKKNSISLSYVLNILNCVWFWRIWTKRLRWLQGRGGRSGQHTTGEGPGRHPGSQDEAPLPSLCLPHFAPLRLSLGQGPPGSSDNSASHTGDLVPGGLAHHRRAQSPRRCFRRKFSRTCTAPSPSCSWAAGRRCATRSSRPSSCTQCPTRWTWSTTCWCSRRARTISSSIRQTCFCTASRSCPTGMASTTSQGTCETSPLRSASSEVQVRLVWFVCLLFHLSMYKTNRILPFSPLFIDINYMPQNK